jgi:hypothetical protein
MSKALKKLMKKLVIKESQEELAVADAKLGNVIKVCKQTGRIQSFPRSVGHVAMSSKNWLGPEKG